MFAICHWPSVCLSSVTFVRPTRAIEIFGNVSTPFGTLATRDLSVTILRRSSQGNPSVGDLRQVFNESRSGGPRKHQNRFRPGLRPGPRWGSSRRSPRPPSRLGRGIPPPHSLPHSVPPSAPRFSRAEVDTQRQRCLDLWLPQCKILATCCVHPTF